MINKIKNLFRLKRIINEVKLQFEDPDSVIDMILLHLFLEGVFDKKDLLMLDIGFLYRCNVSNIVNLPLEDIMSNLKVLEEINEKKFAKMGRI